MAAANFLVERDERDYQLITSILNFTQLNLGYIGASKMSRDCVDAVWKVEIKPATLKLTLMAICDRADNDGYRCYPSIERVCKDTSLNKKTVQSNIKKLIQMGLIEDTGRRVGPTQRVRVLQVKLESIRNRYDPENGMNNDPENGMNNDPENGIQNQSMNQSMNQSPINVRPDGLTDAKIKENMQSGFNHFWETWKGCKKNLGVKNNSTPKETRKKWDTHFSASWWKNHTMSDYDEEVNLISSYAIDAHSNQDEFNPHINMMTGRFFTLQGWKSE